MSEIKRIVAFGDSCTRGEGLPDVPEAEYTPDIPWSKYSWPELLAAKLEVPCINQGQGAASNRLIAHYLWNFDIQPTDLVVVLWTFPERFYIHRHKLRGREPNGKKKLGLHASINWSKKIPELKRFYRDWVTLEDRDLETVMYMDLCKSHAENLGAKYLASTYVDLCTEEFSLPDHVPRIHNHKDNFLDLAADRLHPGVRTQESWADQFYQRWLDSV